MTAADSAFCDTHAHVFGPEERYPYNPGCAYTPLDAPLEAWSALLAQWIPDPALRRRILADNPAPLYGF
ncbi:MAG: hypothetical protein ABI423_00940 [Burkholderiales bacterium]